MHENHYNIFYTDDDVDDQELFIDAAREISANLQVSVQDSGEEVLHLHKTPPPYPKIIFLDLNMPIKNGYEVLTEIKQLEHTKNIPIIVFTTSSDEYSIKKSRSLGANLY